MSADLAVDTAARPDPAVPGRYRHTLPGHWDYLLPSGGVVMTCALRAAAAHLRDPELRLTSATAIFASPIHPGALVSDVHVIRSGRATAQLRVALAHEQAAEPGIEVVATFARDRRGPDVIGAAPPAWAASAGDARPVADDSPKNPHARYRFFEQLETKIAAGTPFWQPDFASGPARYARWFRYRTPQRDAAGRFDRLALAPIIDTMPTALHRAIGPGAYRFAAPSLDLTLYAVDDTIREWLLVAVTVRRARAGIAVGDAEVWDDQGKLVACGAQAMYVQGLSGEPPVIDASRRD